MALQITFTGPAELDDTIVLHFDANYPNTPVIDFTRGNVFKTTRANPGEVVIGTDANSQALNYYNAFLLDYGSSFNIILVANVVTIVANNGSSFFDYGIVTNLPSPFATFDIVADPDLNITISHQPVQDSLKIAYRPIVFRCLALTTTGDVPPVVYCDIYINGIYYKTLSKTQYLNFTGISPEYEFDIQDALQEVMSYNLPEMDGSVILECDKTVRKAFVKFRNAKLDSDGFIVSEQLEPIQQTSSNDAVEGGGILSNEVYVYNATLQHEDNQDFAQFLTSYRTGTWDANSYPLTKRPKTIKMCKNDSSYFPIITDKDVTCLRLNYKLAGGVYQTATYCVPKELILISITNISGNDYELVFSANFALTQLFYEISIDGISWDAPVALSGITSPQTAVITSTVSFYIRIYDEDSTLQRVHNSVYTNIYN